MKAKELEIGDKIICIKDTARFSINHIYEVYYKSDHGDIFIKDCDEYSLFSHILDPECYLTQFKFHSDGSEEVFEDDEQFENFEED